MTINARTHVARPPLATADASRQDVGAVVLHGLTSEPRAVAPLIELSQRLGIHVEAPLLRGHGTHYRQLRGVSWRDWMEDVAMARERLRRKVPRVILMGYSMGAMLALASAVEAPAEVAGIVALAPALRFGHPLAPFAWAARGWMPYVSMRRSLAEHGLAPDELERAYQRLATDAFWSFYRATLRVEHALPLIMAPILIAHSRHDRVARPESARIIFERVGSPDKQLLWLERSNHGLLRGHEQQILLEHIARFVELRCLSQVGARA